MFHSHKHIPLLFAWISNVNILIEVINIFNKTALICNQRIDPGIFARTSKIIFFIRSNNSLQEIAEIIFRHNLIQLSPYVAIAREDKGSISFFSLDFFKPQEDVFKQIMLTYVWTKSKPFPQLKNIYTDQNDFKGLSIRVGAMPVSHCVVAEPISTHDPTWTNTTQFHGHYGFEIEILKACSRVLNFTYKLFNPAVFEYFFVSEDNSYTGLLGDVSRGSFDISMGASLGTFEISQVLDNSISFDQEVYEMASPNPQLVPKIFAIIYPFHNTVWILLTVTFVIVIATFKLISMVEEESNDVVLNTFKTVHNSFQFCLRTILVDSIPGLDRMTRSANKIRYKVSLIKSVILNNILCSICVGSCLPSGFFSA